MSRGLGRIERAIVVVFTAEPDNAFTVGELCERIYPDCERIDPDYSCVDKKHRVAVIRAAQSLSRRWPDLGWRYSQWLGREKIFFNADSVMSFAMARLKGDQFEYGGEEKLRSSLLEGGKNHEHIVEGGAWRRHRDMWLAKRDGDTARLKELEAEQERDLNQIGELLRAAMEKVGL